MDLTDTHRTLYPDTEEESFFSAAHRTFSKIEHIFQHKASLSRSKETEITPCISSGQPVLFLDNNNRLVIREGSFKIFIASVRG